MNGKQLKNSILQWAIQGKLVPQDPNDEPASVLLDKIRQEKERLIKEKKIKRDKNASIIYRGEDNSYYEKILATGEVKCIDEEVPFEIPHGWEWCRLRNIILGTNAGKSPNCEKRPKKSEEWGVLTTTSIQENAFLSNENKVLPKHYVITPEHCVRYGDILITRAGPVNRTGIVCMVENNCDKLILSDKTVRIDYMHDYCNPKFLVFVLNSSAIHELVMSATVGMAASQVNVSQVSIQNTLIPFPPSKEQQRIIDKLGALLPQIEKYDNAQNKLDELNKTVKDIIKKSVLQEAIQGKLVSQLEEEGTAKELLEQIEAEKQKLVKEGKIKKSGLSDSVIFRGDDNKYYELIDDSPVCIDEFLPFQIPETWVWGKVKDLLEIQTGASFKKEQTNANKKGIRILRGGNILPNKYIFKDDDVFVSEEFVNANTILKKNSIITPAVTSLENIGKMAVIEKDYKNVSAGGFVFIISPYIQNFNHSLLLAYFLQSPFLIEAMRGITKKSGAAFYNLGKERLKELYLPLPPMAEQGRIVGKINEVLSSIMSR